jgi:hypothetical protein
MNKPSSMIINIEGKDYSLNIEQGIKIGALIELLIYPLTPGDVYKAKSGGCNPFLLIEALYCTNSQPNPRRWQLLGLATSVNSNIFFYELHTIDEIKEYLAKNDMTFSHNITLGICDLIQSPENNS